MKTIVLAALLLVASAAQAQVVYKCTENGKTTYTSTPCPGMVQAEDATTPKEGPKELPSWDSYRDRKPSIPKNEPPSARAKRLKQLEDERNARWAKRDAEWDAKMEESRKESERESEELLRTCGISSRSDVRVGMSKWRVANCSKGAEPRSVNATTTAGGTHEQWVMGGRGGYQYIYFVDEVVTAIQR